MKRLLQLSLTLFCLITFVLGCSSSGLSGPEDDPGIAPGANVLDATMAFSDGSSRQISAPQASAQIVSVQDCPHGPPPCLALEFMHPDYRFSLFTGTVPSSDPGDWPLPLKLSFQDDTANFVMFMVIEDPIGGAGRTFLNVDGPRCAPTAGSLLITDVSNGQLSGTIAAAVLSSVENVRTCSELHVSIDGVFRATPTEYAP